MKGDDRMLHALTRPSREFTLEAMACGKPVVTDFEDTCGRACYGELPPLVRAREEQDIEDGVARFFARPRWRREVDEASRTWIERFHGQDVVIRRHLDAYDGILKGASA